MGLRASRLDAERHDLVRPQFDFVRLASHERLQRLLITEGAEPNGCCPTLVPSDITTPEEQRRRPDSACGFGASRCGKHLLFLVDGIDRDLHAGQPTPRLVAA